MIFLVATNLFAQENSVIRPGLIKTSLTISPSKLLSTSNSYFYLHGFLEGYLNEKISVAGEGYFYQGIINEGRSDFKYNHALFFGFSRHFTKNNFDFYLGIQPGVMITKINPPYDNMWDNVWDNSKAAVNPSVSALMGINYFVGKYVHFFVQSRLVLAEHQTDYPRNISDLRISAGLGFNLNTMKSSTFSPSCNF
ncbi:MAG: hypothetical protein ACK5B9_14295 [Flavobacteriia bacterium]